MEKTITVDGKDIKLKSHGAIPLLYKQQFGKDFFSEITKIQDIANLDTEVLYNVIWLFAKAADKEIPSTPVDWLMTFDDFPLEDMLTDTLEMVGRLIKSKKK